MQEQLVRASLSYLGSYLVYNLNWKPEGGKRLYGIKTVLKSLKAVPAQELVLRQKYPQHFTSYKGKPYLSYDLVHITALQN